MKNRHTYFILLIIIFIIKANSTFAVPFNIKAEEIIFQNNKKLMIANGNVEIISDNGIIIKGNKLTYDKSKDVLKIYGNIILEDSLKNLKIYSEEIIYDKKIENIFFNKKVKINFNEEYFLDSKNIVYSISDYKIYSKEISYLKDNINNLYTLEGFTYLTSTSMLNSNSLVLVDSEKNELNLMKTYIDFKNNTFAGKDIEIDFNNKSFSKDNEPRLKANALIIKDNVTSLYNGVFTTCKKNDTCPPWSMKAEKISHNKKTKQINYEKAWLKIYDRPILYFPKFFHPDPTVDRQSGFLVPSFKSSKNFGTGLSIPYYKVLADNKDFTFKPRIYNATKSIFQTEYRHNTSNSEHIFDFSYGRLGGTNSHLFSKSLIELDIDYFDTSLFEINLEQTSNNKYIKNYKIKSPLIDTDSKLNSNIKFSAFTPDLLFDVSMEVFEDLNKEDTDKYEYIFPNFNITKLLDISDSTLGQFEVSSSGYSKLYDTNTQENILLNDLKFNSYTKINKFGLQTNYKFLLKNLNTSSTNSSKYDDKFQNKLASAFFYELEYPLKKENKNSKKYFTPKIQARVSPSNTANINYQDSEINTDNVFSLNRIGNSNFLEGGESITLGTEYTAFNNSGEMFANFNLASVFRVNENNDLPYKSGIGNKRSDLIGELKLNPNKYIKFNYDFSIENDLNRSNYDLITTEFSVNNFITTFEYFNEDNIINQSNHLYNKTSYNFDKQNSLSFATRRNRKINMTEFYDLIYEYKNDCLVASLEYNKDYYSDVGLKPEEQLFFSITIMPFGKINSPGFKRKWKYLKK